MKTSELTGAALDWAVAKCEGYIFEAEQILDRSDDSVFYTFRPSTDWAQGGPIIEREKVFVKPTINRGWRSYRRDPFGNGICNSQYGPTPLVAAMRCYVASKLGDDIDIPKELA